MCKKINPDYIYILNQIKHDSKHLPSSLTEIRSWSLLTSPHPKADLDNPTGSLGHCTTPSHFGVWGSNPATLGIVISHGGLPHPSPHVIPMTLGTSEFHAPLFSQRRSV